MRPVKRWAVVAVAAASIAAPAYGQAPNSPRDGAVNRAVVNTICAEFIRQGRSVHCSDSQFQSVASQAQAAINAAAVSGRALTGNTGSGSAPSSWHEVIAALGLAWPFKLGDPASPNGFQGGGGSSGGGGAGGSWEAGDVGSDRSCGIIDYMLDPQGNLIIPSYSLAVGKGVKVAKTGQPGSVTWYMGSGDSSVPVLGNHYVHADSYEAVLRRYMHLTNIRQPSAKWYGVLGPARETSWSGYAVNCYEFATVAYRLPDNTLVPRVSDVTCAVGPAEHTQAVASNESPATPTNAPHKDCPPDGTGSTDFHFYGDGDATTHWHTCIMYFAAQGAGWNGYALNKKTTLRAADKWKWFSLLPGWIKKCGADRDLIRKLAQEVLQEVEPGATIDPSSARPGDVTVNDLNDDPTAGVTNPPADPQAPPPAPPPPATPGTGGGTDTCDFGPNGCTDPGTGAPTLTDPPTSIMDPIFNWLPDLPSITFPDLSSACPVWNVDMRSFGGPNWQWLMDSHCQVSESIRDLIGALMIAVWGIGAALIILRA